MAISEKKLAYYERLASETNEATAKAIEQLIAEVRRLRAELDNISDERSNYGVIGYFKGRSDALDVAVQIDKEADWLARYISTTSMCVDPKKNATDEHCGGDKCVKCWREAARRAVKND